jgi:hypothetical protein
MGGGCIAYSPNQNGGFDVLKGPLDLLRGKALEELKPVKFQNYTPDSPLASQNGPSVGLRVFRDVFK